MRDPVSGDSDGDEMSMVVNSIPMPPTPLTHWLPHSTCRIVLFVAGENAGAAIAQSVLCRSGSLLDGSGALGMDGESATGGDGVKATRRPRNVPGCTIWPQPKINPRQRYRITYSTGMKLPSGKPERKTITGSTDLETTVELATKLNRRNERVRTGLDAITEADFDANARRLASEHLDDYRKSLIAAGCDPKDVRQMHDKRAGRADRFASEINGGASAWSESWHIA